VARKAIRTIDARIIIVQAILMLVVPVEQVVGELEEGRRRPELF